MNECVATEAELGCLHLAFQTGQNAVIEYNKRHQNDMEGEGGGGDEHGGHPDLTVNQNHLILQLYSRPSESTSYGVEGSGEHGNCSFIKSPGEFDDFLLVCEHDEVFLVTTGNRAKIPVHSQFWNLFSYTNSVSH